MLPRPQIDFDRLFNAVEQVTIHAYYPGKKEAVKFCMDDVDALFHEGRIDAEQWGALQTILRDGLASST